MSDIFDHEFDAYDAEISENSWVSLFPEWSKVRPPRNGIYRANISIHSNHWVCTNCRRKHPLSHKKCYWCEPTR